MKKVLSILLVTSLLASIMITSAAYADKPGDSQEQDGIQILKKAPPKDLRGVISGLEQSGLAKWRKSFSSSDAPAGFVGAPVRGERYAVVIGINDYPGQGSVLEGGLDLFYAVADTEAVFNMLVGIKGFKPENVIMLTDRSATKSSVLDQIKALKKKVNRGDEVVFYFSGHSAQYTGKPSNTGSFGLWKSGIVVWADDLNETAPAVVWDKELKTAFTGFKTDRIIFGFDCCYAGGFSNLAGLGGIVVMASEADGISGEYGEAYADIGMGPLPDIGWLNQGLFTYFFVVQGLTWGVPEMLNPQDGITTIEEAFYYAQPILTGFTQQAQGMGLDEIPVMRDWFYGDLDL